MLPTLTRTRYRCPSRGYLAGWLSASVDHLEGEAFSPPRSGLSFQPESVGGVLIGGASPAISASAKPLEAVMR